MAKRTFLVPMVVTAIIGAAGLGLIKSSEGLRTTTYLDPVGIPTVCYGHTGPEVRMGQRYSVAECDAILMDDIDRHRKGVQACIKAPLTANQRDAVVSFAFNVGVSKFCRSTMAKRLNARDYIGAADEFPKWRFANVRGRATVLPGLVKRRAAERQLYLTPSPASASYVSDGPLRALWGTL